MIRERSGSAAAPRAAISSIALPAVGASAAIVLNSSSMERAMTGVAGAIVTPPPASTSTVSAEVLRQRLPVVRRPAGSEVLLLSVGKAGVVEHDLRALPF